MTDPNPNQDNRKTGNLAQAALGHYVRSIRGFSRDARLFLLITILFGSAMSLYWTDFNLYVKSRGLDDSTCGWLLTVSQLAGFLVALPASALSDRFGRRSVMVGGGILVTMALFAFLPGEVGLLFVGVAAMGGGSQIVGVVQIPFMAEHTRPDQRNDYFSIWQAIQFSTGFLSMIVGGAAASWLAPQLGLTSESAPYELLLMGVLALGVVSLGSFFLLSNDKPADPASEARANRPGRFGLVITDRRLFVRLLLPGFLTSLGAGQLIPFLNIFVATKFNLGLAEVNTFFAIASLGTAIAILAQPAVAKKFGRIGAIVLVQGASIPFIVVLGFSPMLWSVVLALAVRNSLMNAGSPIFDAFAMDRVSDAERATLAAGMSMLWSLGWVIAPIYYGVLHDRLGFGGYTVNFVTIIVLYTIATSMLWTWFHADSKSWVTAPDESLAVPASPTLVTGEG